MIHAVSSISPPFSNTTDLRCPSGEKTMALSEESVKESLKTLQNQIQEKETFKGAVSSIKAHLIDYYHSASPSLRDSFYAIVCNVESTLQTRYTESELWLAGRELFEEAQRNVVDSSEREYLRTCIAMASDYLDTNNTEQVDPTGPPRSTLQVAHELLATLNVVVEESSQGLRDANNTLERASVLMEEMVTTMQEFSGVRNLMDSIEAAMQDMGSARPMRQPPASKEVIEKLPVVTISKEMMDRLGSDMECAVCRENLYIAEKMQELPCKHLFHQLCLEPWMEMHNSCPICRHELPTDNEAYESWKKREREAKMTLQTH